MLGIQPRQSKILVACRSLFLGAFGIGFAFGQATAAIVRSPRTFVRGVRSRFASLPHPLSLPRRFATRSNARASKTLTNAPTPFPHCTATLTQSQEQRAEHIWLLARVPPARQQGAGYDPAPDLKVSLSLGHSLVARHTPKSATAPHWTADTCLGMACEAWARGHHRKSRA